MTEQAARENMENLTNSIVRCGELLVREAGKRFKPFRVSPGQFNVLHLLHLRGKPLRPSEIAESLVVDPASTTYLLDTLVKKGWIERKDDPADRRAYLVSLTAAGRTKHESVDVVYQESLARLARDLGSVPGVAELPKLIERVGRAVE